MAYRNLPDVILDSLQDVEHRGWNPYLTLCRRYQIEPDEYVDFILENYNFHIQLRSDIFITMFNTVVDLSLLSGVLLPNVKVIRLPHTAEDLNGLSDLLVPRLKILTLDGKYNCLNNLANFRSQTIKTLIIQGQNSPIPSLTLPTLRNLTVTRTGLQDISFLNSSNLDGLKSLAVCNPIILEEQDIVDLTEIEWGRYPQLIRLSILYTIFNTERIVIDNNLPKSLEYLKIDQCTLKTYDTVNLPNLSKLVITEDSVPILEQLNMPILHKLTVLKTPNPMEESGPYNFLRESNNDQIESIRKILKDDKVRITLKRGF